VPRPDGAAPGGIPRAVAAPDGPAASPARAPVDDTIVGYTAANEPVTRGELLRGDRPTSRWRDADGRWHFPDGSTVREAPATVREAPAAVREAPATVREAPATVREAPATVREAPATVREAPATVREAPATVRDAPATARAPESPGAQGGASRAVPGERAPAPETPTPRADNAARPAAVDGPHRPSGPVTIPHPDTGAPMPAFLVPQEGSHVLARGVHGAHPVLPDALQGRALPSNARAGISPDAHIASGSANSQFVSWSHDVRYAMDWAESGGGGALLLTRVQADTVLPREAWTEPARGEGRWVGGNAGEGEILREGGSDGHVVVTPDQFPAVRAWLDRIAPAHGAP
jgi:hypothetical protein